MLQSLDPFGCLLLKLLELILPLFLSFQPSILTPKIILWFFPPPSPPGCTKHLQPKMLEETLSGKRSHRLNCRIISVGTRIHDLAKASLAKEDALTSVCKNRGWVGNRLAGVPLGTSREATV